MIDKIKIGFAGAGWMGGQFLNKIPLKDNAELLAVYDPKAESIKNVLKRSRVNPDCFVSDYEDIIANDDIDAVMIASPNAFHAEQSLKALNAGKHVFCEKPNSTHWEDHLRMVKADHDHPELITMTNYTLFFDQLAQIIKKMLDRRMFGEITQMQINYRHAVNIKGDKAWKLKKDFIGDALGMGITHAVFLMCHYFSPIKPVSVFACSQKSTTGRFEVHPIWSMLISFENGSSGMVLGDIENGNSYDLYQNILGTKGGLVFDSQTKFETRLKYWADETNREWVYPFDHENERKKGQDNHCLPTDISMPTSGDVVHHSTEESLDYFLEHIENKKDPYLGFENMRIVQDINFAAQLSAKIKKSVDIPADPSDLKRHLG